MPYPHVIPVPVAMSPASGEGYEVTPHTVVRAGPGAVTIAGRLAGMLRRSTGLPLPVSTGPGDGIRLRLADAPAEYGDEGYRLATARDHVTISAHRPAGLFRGGQTLRQLLPPAVEYGAPRPGPWRVPAVRIDDRPRFPYRGMMLDVARHFFDVATVVRYLDLLALYKINHLHLHLTDDQGWRIAVDSWPELARRGGATAVGGGAGGHYRKDDYRRIVAEAARRFITVVPEIDVPGHVHAALTAYPELGNGGPAPAPYTGTRVGFSTLHTGHELTHRFVRDVFGELAALTPGPYLHLGGDEAHVTDQADYARFVSRVQEVVVELGKTPVGWHETATAGHAGGQVLQFWGTGSHEPRVAAAVAAGARVVLSPARHTYLDMKYDADTPLGMDWAGPIEVHDAYGWDPGAYLEGVPAEAVLGVEAPLWSETVATRDQLDYLAFPRLPAIAERGWSPAAACDWDGFCDRLAAHGQRWQLLGVNFHRSPQVPWNAPPA